MTNPTETASAPELERLFSSLPAAMDRAADALRTDPPGQVLEGAAMTKFVVELQRLGAIVRRIRELQ